MAVTGCFFYVIAGVTFSLVGVTSPYLALVPGMVLGGIGIGLFLSSNTAAAQAHVHQDKIADNLSRLQEHAVNGVLAGTDSAQTLLSKFPDAAEHLQALAGSAFVEGMQAAFRLDALLGLLALVIAAFFIGGRLSFRRAPRRAEAPSEPVSS
jgi:hypothetical protein